jgi:hypothetical protein
MLAQASKVRRAGSCYCHVPMHELERWARRRYIEGVPTLELLRTAPRPRDRAVIAMVALLDVPDEEARRILRPRATPRCNVLQCREHVMQWLAAMLVTAN